ncbi:MAG TPA: universal stress protein [Streptosporangiaceae bacterium]
MRQIWTKTPRVIVGFDDSPAARWALAWAVGEARLRDLPLLVAHVIQPDREGVRAPALPGVPAVPAVDDLAGIQRGSSVAIARLLAEMTGPAGPEATATCPYGHAGAVLTELAHDGDLLVIGQGRRRLLSRLLRGSTQGYCARHARATLVVVPAPSFAELSSPADALEAAPPRGRTKRSRGFGR